MPSRPLRVAFVNASLDIGGSERQMVTLATHLPRDRFDLEFILLKNRGPLAARIEDAGIPIDVLDWPPGRSPIRQPPAVARLASSIRRGRFDIVDAWLFHAYGLVGLMRPVAQVPVLIAGRRSLSDYKRAFGPAERLLDRLTRSSADCIVANATAVRDEAIAYEGLDPVRLRVVRNGIDLAAPLEEAVRSAVRAGWGFTPDDLVIGSVANYKTGKGLEGLVEAMADIIPTVPTARLVLIGEGPRRLDLERLVERFGLGSSVRLHGSVPDARLVVGAFDIAVQASESEGLPNAVLEAAAAGVPVVATDAGGTREVLAEGEAGLLVPIRDQAALARGIRRLAVDARLRHELATRARAHVAATFGIDRFVAETAAVYEELAEARGVRW